MRILHTADLHLKTEGDERWQTLRELIAIGVKENISLFVICGDLFDKGLFADRLRINIRKLFSGCGFKILIIPGNHDRDSYRPGNYFGEDVIMMNESPLFEDEEVRVAALPYKPLEKGEILNNIRSLKKIFIDDCKQNILLYHGELLDAFFSTGGFGGEEEGRYMPVKLSYFKELKIDYLLAGHFHADFEIKRLTEGGGYFVYPGSPVSITRKELGRRKINLFETGMPPREYPLDTPHFEEVVVTLDPFTTTCDPLKLVSGKMEKLHPQAKVFLTVKGYINGKKLGMGERDLIAKIREFTMERCQDSPVFELKDIQKIMEDDLFKLFMQKLDGAGYMSEKSALLRDIAIKAIMEAGL